MFFAENREKNQIENIPQTADTDNTNTAKPFCPIGKAQLKTDLNKDAFGYSDYITKILNRVKSSVPRRTKTAEKYETAVVEAQPNRDKKPAAPAVAVYVKREKLSKRIWRDLKPQICAGALTVTLLIGLCVGVNASDYRLGYEAIVDGETLGLVTNTEQVDTAIELVQEELKQYMGDDVSYSREPVYIRRIVSSKEVSTPEEMKKKLLANVDCMVECSALYIDGNAVAGLVTPEAAQWVLDRYKARYIEANAIETESIEFCENVEIKNDFLTIGMLLTPEETLAMLEGTVSAASTSYTTADGDTLWGIAQAYGMSVDKIKELNPDINEDSLQGGMLLTLEQPVPMLSVKTIQTLELTETLPREVQQIEDSELYEGTTTVAQEGEDGEAKVVAKITKINGTEQERVVLSSETTKASVAKIERIGTKEIPPTTGSGSFIRPAYGLLSSRFGGRWGRHHNGIDIAGAANSNVLAADGGVVTYAGWMQGYGNYVVINHENGYETAYGHNNSILVSVGDRVAKGSVIAKMGNTGNSTGNHCHFEVKKNGEFLDPLKFVNY